jgi:hypothetical protein
MPDDIERSEAGDPIYRHEPRERDFEFASGDPNDIARIEEHIEAHIGKADSVFHELVSDLVHIDLHLVPPSGERDFHTIVTSGMSGRPMNAPAVASEYRYAEMMMALPADWPLRQEDFQNEDNYWPLRWLKILARLPHEYNTWLCYLHTVPNGDPAEPFSDNTKLCCAMIAKPVLFGEEFTSLRVNEDKQVFFYSLIPIYQEEMEFKLRHGGDSLIDRLDEIGVTELLDVTRSNVCAA